MEIQTVVLPLHFQAHHIIVQTTILGVVFDIFKWRRILESSISPDLVHKLHKNQTAFEWDNATLQLAITDHSSTFVRFPSHSMTRILQGVHRWFLTLKTNLVAVRFGERRGDEDVPLARVSLSVQKHTPLYHQNTLLTFSPWIVAE